MADLVVRPAYQMGPNDILTVDKFNLMATPIVELTISDRVDDQSFFRNGNFYSSFWTTPGGMDCPAGVETTNADYWSVNPTGGDINCLRSDLVPDTNSLFSMELAGAAGVTDVRVSQIINGDLSATMRRPVTFSGYIRNAAGLAVSPKLEIWTCDSFNNFNTVTLQTTVDLQTCADAIWTPVSVGLDLSTLANVANGMKVAILIPSGALSATTKSVCFSRIKIQIGELATEFVDDVGLFVQTPSVDSTMLQDGCIARPGLFLPSVIPKGAYQPKSIQNGDIDDGAIDGRTLLPSVTTTLSAPGFVQPAVGANVPIVVGSTVGLQANRPIQIVGGGAYTIFSITDGTNLVVTNSGGAGNAAPATPVPAGGNVTQTGAVAGNLGYVPVNKAGDSNVGIIDHQVDTVVGPLAAAGAAVTVALSSANAANAGYFPALGFVRGTKALAFGLDLGGNLETVDDQGVTGRLLDSVHGVDTASIQDGSVTLAKLAASLIAILIPPGTVRAFAGTVPPNGWLICDGSPISRTTYSALFTAIGTLWGGGDGTLTFNLPDLRGRSLLGYVNSAGSGLTTRAFAARGGEEAHVLTVAELAVHTHVVSDPTHSHTPIDNGHSHQYGGGLQTPFAAQPGTTGIWRNDANQNTTTNPANITIQARATGVTNQNTGSNTAHNTMHPFAVVLLVIKT